MTPSTHTGTPRGKGAVAPITATTTPQSSAHPDPDGIGYEAGLIGTLLSYPERWTDEAKDLVSTDFSDPAHAAIWIAMQTVRCKGQNTDIITIMDELGESISMCGGQAYLGTLTQIIPHTQAVKDYAWAIKRRSIVRQRDQAAKDKNFESIRELDQQLRDMMPLILGARKRPLSGLANALTILEKDERWHGVLGYDSFAERATLIKPPPFIKDPVGWTTREVRDDDDTNAAAWFTHEYRMTIGPETTAQASQAIARQHPYHPVRDYLNSLVWDGIPRLDGWLCDHFGAEESTYTKAVASKTLIAAVARVFRPGCKVDTVPILEGAQGIGKSTAWRILASDDWFTDTMPDLHSKDAMQGLAGKWIVELAELSAMARSEVEAVKRFISANQDCYRPSYGRRNVTLPRQCIFVGTTNADEYLQDVTGNRRWWPIEVTRCCDMARLRADRNQLWAEAVYRFQQGEQWHLDADTETLASEVAAAKVTIDIWEDPIMAYLDDRPEIDSVSVGELLDTIFKIEQRDWRQPDLNRVARILKFKKWRRTRINQQGKREWRYMRPIRDTQLPTKNPAMFHDNCSTETRKEVLVPVVPVWNINGPSIETTKTPYESMIGPSGPSGPSKKDKVSVNHCIGVIEPTGPTGTTGTTGPTGPTGPTATTATTATSSIATIANKHRERWNQAPASDPLQTRAEHLIEEGLTPWNAWNQAREEENLECTQIKP